MVTSTEEKVFDTKESMTEKLLKSYLFCDGTSSTANALNTLIMRVIFSQFKEIKVKNILSNSISRGFTEIELEAPTQNWHSYNVC